MIFRLSGVPPENEGCFSYNCGMMDALNYKPIGIIHSPIKEQKGAPIQSIGGRGLKATVEVFPEYRDGLKDIDGFSYLMLLFHFDRAKTAALVQKPYMDHELRGVFAIRSPNRPNPIGLSIVKLISVESNLLHVEDIDILDGTPLLDIKPYIPEIDCRFGGDIGWLAGKIEALLHKRAD